MRNLNAVDIDTPSGIRSFELVHGDVTALGFPVDLLMISAVGSHHLPMRGTVIGALSSEMGISVDARSKDPEFAFIEPAGRLWVSRVVDPTRITRIMCVEIPYGGTEAKQIVQQAFRSLPMLEARGLPLTTICLPLLGTGLHGLNTEGVLLPILEGAQWALRVLKSVDRICFAENNLQRANEISVAMDGVLGRVKVAVAKGGAFETVRKEISAQIDRLDTSYQGDTRVAERLRKAITLGSRSTDLGMAGRLLREFVLTQILAPADIKKMTPFATMQELRRQLISEWIICYLQLLHAFGNEVAHHKTSEYSPTAYRRPRPRYLSVCYTESTGFLV